jgi:hypothetical protein
VALLRRREFEPANDAAGLCNVVVANGGLEAFPERLGLTKLAAQPAQEAHPRCASHRLETHTASLFVITNPIRT